jgi:DnaJ-class molecular chaperone
MFDNYYKLFDIYPNASMSEIKNAYNNLITKFYNIKKFNKKQIEEIKNIKKGLYILTHPILKQKYDIYIGINKLNKKEKESNQVISDRIFSLSFMNKTPGYSECESSLRIPLQGRDDKTQNLISKNNF